MSRMMEKGWIRSLFGIVGMLLLVNGLRGQDLRFFVSPYTDTLNHSSTYEGFKNLMISEYVPAGKRPAGEWIADKFLRENFGTVRRPGYVLTFDPLFENALGREFMSSRNLVTNTRAVRVQGRFTFGNRDRHDPPVDGVHEHKKKDHHPDLPELIFSSSYYESQSMFAPYFDSIIQEHRVTPGQVDYRGSGQYMDHSYAEGWLRYRPNKIFSFEAGQGKNFFGNGYRSMFLSDAAVPYPYFRIDSRFWRIHYVNLWAEFQDHTHWEGYGYPYQKKYGAFHYLSFAVTDRLEISAFEVINWQGRDSTHTRAFELAYLNPVIFLRPVEWTVGSPDNALLGAGFSYRFADQGYVYGQWILDEFNFSKVRDWKAGHAENKYGGQAGAHVRIDLKGIGQPYVFLQSEYNFARPFTFSHLSSKSNYGHMGFSLAHPLGGNFMEWLNIIRAGIGRWTIEGRYSRALIGDEKDGINSGHNVFLPYTEAEGTTGVFIGYGERNSLVYTGLTASYLLNPYSNFNLFVSVLNRTQKTPVAERQDLLFRIGLRSSVRNLHDDF